MTGPGPAVAVGGDESPDAWSGVWIAGDIEQIATGVTNGSWVDGTLGVVSAGLDGLTFVSDPIGGLRDVSRPNGSMGFTPEEIERIRRHVFVEEHPLNDYDGGIVHRRHDASPDMAEAWLRLRGGRQRPEDVALLEHELAESRYYADHPGSTYEEAHAAANAVSNWQNQIPEPTREDYSEPWG